MEVVPPILRRFVHSSRILTLAAALALTLAGLLAYANSFGVPLLLDDIASIANNPSIRQLAPMSAVLSPPADVGLGGRPLANLSFALNYAWSGTRVTSYHGVNLCIHVAAALTLFGIARRTLALPSMRTVVAPAHATPLAFVIALLWLLHPLHTESVIYISQRTESLMGLWYLITLYTFIRGATETRSWFAVSVLCCALGMATKEVMVTAPAIVLLYDRTFLAGSFREAWQQRKRVFLALGATWVLLLFLLTDVHERGVGYATVSWWQYAFTSARSILQYVRLAFWPSPLVFDYGTTILRRFSEAWPYVITMSVALGGTIVALRRSPRMGFALAWVFIVLAPTSSVVPVAGQPMAEHRMYLPLVAIIAMGAIALVRRFGAGTFIVLPLAAVAAGYATFDRNRDYASALALWSDTVAKVPNNARAHASLGAVLLEQGRLEPAITALQTSLRLDPGTAEAHNNLAMALVDAGRPSEAVAHFTAALQLRPAVASTRYNFGNALLQLGRVSEALAQQQQALILQPDLAEAHCALGQALAASGRGDEAIASYQTCIRLQPGLIAGHFGLANALAQAGRIAESIPHYLTTVHAVPNSVDAHFNAGNALFALGRTVEALGHYQAVIQLKPDFADAHNNAANALASAGRVPEAIAHYETALKLNPDLAPAQLNLDALRKAAAQRR